MITALMVICNEPLCVEWRHQALQGLQFPDHPNHVAQIWVALTPLLQPNLSEQLTGIDGTDLGQDMQDRLKAAQQIMQGVRFWSLTWYDMNIWLTCHSAWYPMTS
ncbi:MAG: hypothetical protein HC767_01755 [Akkermansiaceae bacterium]|nr:hypothetical protein [Akkermansiaceae bacterium]